MSYAHSDRLRILTRRGFALAVVASLGLPLHTTSAQLGGLAKKARDRIVDQQVEKRTNNAGASSSAAAPAFDDVTLELTNDRIGQIVRGLTAGRAVLDGANGSPSRTSLVARRDEANNKRVALSDQNAKAFDAYTEKRDENQRCRNDAIRALRDTRQQATEQRQKEFQAKAMSDPAFREKAMATAQKIAIAQQRGDTVEMRRLMAELGGVAEDPKADSLAADRTCGREPAKPAAMVQAEQLDAEANKLSDQIRQLEEKSQATEVNESGMTERQFFMARERIEAYLSSVKFKSQPRVFSATELDALRARRADLEKVM
jgi:hypothetical protein